MKAVVIGGGVVGITTAYYLAKDGHEVTLLEKETELATLASGGNAGLIAPGHSFAWASPAAPKELWRSLTSEDTALRVNPLKAPGMFFWGLRFLRECTADRSVKNTLVKLRLARYSQARLDELTASEKIDYHDVHQGCIYVYRDRAKFEAGIKKMKLITDQGQEQTVLDPDGVVEVEPVFKPVKAKIVGAIYGPTDASGDSVKLTNELADRCRTMGVKIELGTGVHRLAAERDRVRAAVTDQGTVEGDLFVLAAGVQSAALSKTVGVGIPVAPAKGYSATFPIKNGGDAAPTVGGVDEQLLVAWCRMGDRLRLTGSAEFTGYQTTHSEKDFHGVMKLARELFPDAADYEAGSFRACNRPMTPDGPPILGTARHANLYYNTGHGHMGFTMACGTSKLTADLVAGRKTDIPIDGMTLTSRP
ncbi:MAG TPA: FAD-dependent oxidoreductase [Candidatus Dormibacteraeota bacterium]|nr:FAD-dependent oxidoreductase [Candidatus Dormibacteraeota bacterium]